MNWITEIVQAAQTTIKPYTEGLGAYWSSVGFAQRVAPFLILIGVLAGLAIIGFIIRSVVKACAGLDELKAELSRLRYEHSNCTSNIKYWKGAYEAFKREKKA